MKKMGKFETVVKNAPTLDLKGIKDFIEQRSLNISEKEMQKRIGSNLKDYMNGEEKDKFSWMLITAAFGDLYRKTLVSFGNITKDEHRELKTAMTHLEKYTELVLTRLHPKARKDALDRIAVEGLEIKILDSKMMNKFRESLHEDMKFCRIPENQFYDFTEHMLRIHCKECNIHFSNCNSIYDIFVDNRIPESGHCNKNCPYSYNETSDYEKYIQCLQEIREQKLGIAMDKKFEGIREMLELEINALDIAISAVANMKQGEIKGDEAKWTEEKAILPKESITI